MQGGTSNGREKREIAARIIGALAGVTSGSTRRAGFAYAHTAPYPKFGFTLAEVLITLGIIGIVAAMTMPTLIQKHQEKVTVTQLKKSYSILSQALNFAIAENGTVDNWKLYTFEEDRGEDEGSVEMTIFEPYNLTKNLKFSKDCDARLSCM